MARNVEQPADLVKYIQRLEDRLEKQERGRRLRPYLQLNYYTNASYNNPPVTTTNSTYTSLYRISALSQHPAVEAKLRIVAGAGTGGNIQFYDVDNDFVIWQTSVDLNFSGEVLAVGNLSQNVRYGESFSFEIQVQRTVGSGTIGVLPMYVYGRERV